MGYGAGKAAGGGSGSGMTQKLKNALLQWCSKTAFIDDQGAEYYQDLYDALYSSGPDPDLVSISAVYTQSGTVYDTDSLNDLKDDLVVTATYSDSTTEAVPGSDYILSGTLAVGISTITVSYGGKTTTFTVTVSDSRHVPAQYTWLYDARDNALLSDKSYVTMTSSGTVVETISDGQLVLHCDNNGSAGGSTNVLLTFSLTDTTTTNAIMSARAKLIDLALLNGIPIGQRFQLSNGTTGAAAYLLNGSSDPTKIAVAYYEGSTAKSIETSFAINEYHVFELRLQNGTQSFSIDGTQIFSTSTLSSAYTASNVMRLQATSSDRCPNGVTTIFDWIAYYEP